MRTQELEIHFDQVAKLRTRLQDMNSDPCDIVKPVGMRTKLFENRVQRLAKHERAIMQKLCNGLARLV